MRKIRITPERVAGVTIGVLAAGAGLLLTHHSDHEADAASAHQPHGKLVTLEHVGDAAIFGVLGYGAGSIPTGLITSGCAGDLIGRKRPEEEIDVNALAQEIRIFLDESQL